MEFKSDLVGHNVAFDVKFLRVKNKFPKDYPFVIHDTKIMAHLVNDKVPKAFLDWYEEERKRKNKELPKGQTYRETSGLSLKVIAPWYLKVDPFWETPGNYDNEDYNKKDCVYTYQLFHLFKKKLIDEGSWDFYMNRMLEWSKMVMEMEIRGITIDMNELEKVQQEYFLKREFDQVKLDLQWTDAHSTYYDLQVSQLRVKYTDMAQKALLKTKNPLKTSARYSNLLYDACEKLEKKVSYSSPNQLKWLLSEHLKLDIRIDSTQSADVMIEVIEKGKVVTKKNASTNKTNLNRLVAAGHVEIQPLLDWREAEKVLTMYTPSYQELQVDSIIHPSFNLTGTRTGRTSSSGPNLQQVPSKLYRLFKPRSGYKFIQYDLSGIEAALIALYSGDKTLYDILAKGDSIHDHNAKALFGLNCDVKEVAKLHPRERKTAKTIGFACFYGAGAKRIKAAFLTSGYSLNDQQARAKLNLLKEYYPSAFSYHKEITEIFESGEVVHNLFGRPLKIQPDENAYMQGYNTLIQSSASDLNLRACEKASKLWKKRSFDAYPLLVIHDCVIAEAKNEVSIESEQILIDALTQFKLESINGAIQLRVEGQMGDQWTK